MRKETVTAAGIRVVETRYDRGFTEIAVYRPINATAFGRPARKLTAVVSRQIRGGKWVVHTDQRSRAFLSRIKSEAVAWAVDYATN